MACDRMRLALALSLLIHTAACGAALWLMGGAQRPAAAAAALYVRPVLLASPEPWPPEVLPPRLPPQAVEPVDLPAPEPLLDDMDPDAYPDLLEPETFEAWATAAGLTQIVRHGRSKRRREPAPKAAPKPTSKPVAAPAAPRRPVVTRARSLGGSVAYPAHARRLGLEGTVVLRVKVGADGFVAVAEVLRSSGHATLDRAAKRAVGKWRFAPAKRDGVPFAQWVYVPVRFEIRSRG